jgi:hypothetical protein
MEFNSYIGIIAVVIVFARFVSQLGKGIPILEMMTLIAGLQWIIGPILEYQLPSVDLRYSMYVAEADYMSFVVPAFLAFAGIIFFVIRKVSTVSLPIAHLAAYKKQGLNIFIFGLIFDFFGGSLPGFLGFFVYLFASFKYAGAIILYFSDDQKYRTLFYISIVYLFLRSLSNAMFHDFILWSTFFYMFWAIKFKPSVKTILSTFLIAFVSLSSLQTVKTAYRSEVWGGYEGNKVSLFFALFTDALLNEGLFAEVKEEEVDNNVRLNQGWIISAIMDHVPNNEPFFEGETIRTAFETAALPGVMRKNKTVAGGRENFRRFTGLEIGEGTSMGISIVGEAYGNYGVNGGILFMALWGLFLGRIWLFLMKYSHNNLLFLAFLPLIFLQVVKAETELVVVLNHLIKAMVLVFLFFMLIRKRKNAYSYG